MKQFLCLLIASLTMTIAYAQMSQLYGSSDQSGERMLFETASAGPFQFLIIPVDSANLTYTGSILINYHGGRLSDGAVADRISKVRYKFVNGVPTVSNKSDIFVSNDGGMNAPGVSAAVVNGAIHIFLTGINGTIMRHDLFIQRLNTIPQR